MRMAKDNDSIYLQVGEQDDADGEVMIRSSMPTDAYQTALTVRHSDVANTEPEGADDVLEVWVVPR